MKCLGLYLVQIQVLAASCAILETSRLSTLQLLYLENSRAVLDGAQHPGLRSFLTHDVMQLMQAHLSAAPRWASMRGLESLTPPKILQHHIQAGGNPGQNLESGLKLWTYGPHEVNGSKWWSRIGFNPP